MLDLLELSSSALHPDNNTRNHPEEISRTYQRKYKRQHIKVQSHVEVYLQNGFLFDEGNCTIQDLSPDGAMATRICLKNESFPLVPFILKFRITEGEFEGLVAKGEPVRFINSQGKLGIGVRFSDFEMEVPEDELL